MKRLITLAVLCMISACQSPKDSLIGEWEVDQEAFNQTLVDLKVSPPASTLAMELSEPINHWRFAFHPNRKLVMSVNGRLLKGRYQVSRTVSNTVYVRAEVKPTYVSKLDAQLEVKPPKNKVQTHRLSMRITGNRATLSLDDMRPMKLKRSSNRMKL